MRRTWGRAGWIGAPLLVVAALWGGCAGPAPVVTPGPLGGLTPATPHFLALDPAAQAAVEAPMFLARRLADGRLQVVAALRNHSAGPVHARVACVFFGAGTQPEVTPWQEVKLAPGATRSVTFTAPDARPDRYSVRLGTIGRS